MKPGDEVQVDNSNFLAAQTYHRHQLPGPEYSTYNQFRGPDGKPLYPQRNIQLGPIFAAAAAGSVPIGKFHGKMIVVQSLWDREAFPWHADWYRKRVQANFGATADERLRVWFTDRGLHGGVEDPTRVISYIPLLQQALHDVAAWVETGTPPPSSTAYRIDEGQVVLPSTAAARKGGFSHPDRERRERIDWEGSGNELRSRQGEDDEIQDRARPRSCRRFARQRTERRQPRSS